MLLPCYVTNTTLKASDENELEHFKQYRAHHMQRVYSLCNQQQLGVLKEKLANVLTSQYQVAPVAAVAYYDSDIVYKVFPDLRKKLHSDGLLEIGELEFVQPGVYRRGDFLLFAHRYFRRSFSMLNGLNEDFLSRLQELAHRDALSIRLRIDPDLIGLFGTQHSDLEYGYWWGPHFNDDLSKIPLGVTHYENDVVEELFSNVHSTDFRWYVQDGQKTLEIEEVCCAQENIEDGEYNYFGCRYIHSFLNPQTNMLCHLDGAVRAYTAEKMIERVDKTLQNAGRDTNYTKIWRIDGKISISDWKELITHYYRDNQMVGEYLNGKDQQFEAYKMEDARRQTIMPLPVEQFLPVFMDKGDGLRVYYRHDLTFSPLQYDVEVYSTDFVRFPDGTSDMKVIESDTITVLKLIRSYGATVRFPRTQQIAFEETVVNFPIFRCKNPKVASHVQKALSTLCIEWKKAGDNRLISYSIAINLERNSFQISFAGHVSDFCMIFNKLGTDFPDDSSLFPWIERLYHINNQFPHANLSPSCFRLLTQSGELKFRRVLVPHSYISFNASNQLSVTCSLSSEDAKIIEKNGIQIAPVFLIKSSRCAQCGKNYQECDCIKYINTSEKIDDACIAGCFWTIRHADYTSSKKRLEYHP